MPTEIPSTDDRGGAITPAKVRMFMADQQVRQNLLDMDLQFTEQEIGNAMESAAMDFNEMDPQVVFVTASTMPYGMCFLFGIGYYLLLAKLQEWMRSDLAYQAGNMTVSPQSRRIDHFKEMLKLFREEFASRSKAHKLRINIHSAFAAL